MIQMPIFIALYQVIRTTLGGTPESMLSLEGRLYNWDVLRDAIQIHPTLAEAVQGAALALEPRAKARKASKRKTAKRKSVKRKSGKHAKPR